MHAVISGLKYKQGERVNSTVLHHTNAVPSGLNEKRFSFVSPGEGAVNRSVLKVSQFFFPLFLPRNIHDIDAVYMVTQRMGEGVGGLIPIVMSKNVLHSSHVARNKENTSAKERNYFPMGKNNLLFPCAMQHCFRTKPPYMGRLQLYKGEGNSHSSRSI